jgi:hypothetical protein
MRVGVSRTVGLLVCLASFGFFVGAAALGQETSSLRARAPGPSRPFIDIFDQSKPLMLDGAGEETTLAVAAQKAGYPILRPRSAGMPSEVWIGDVGEGRFEVGLRYGETLVVLLSPWPNGDDPTASFESKVDAYGAGYTTTFDGNPAWVRPYDSAKDAVAVDAIHVAARGVEVILYGRTGIDDLIAYADDLA